jgi:hypothetical protein
MKILKLGLIMATIAFMTAGAANADLVTNGGFETGDLTGWAQVVGDSTTLIVVDWNPHSGTYNATTFYTPTLQFLVQNISTTPGQSYTVGFWLSNGDSYPDNEFVARWDGETKISLLNQDYNFPDYTYYSYTGVATGNSTTIGFGFYNIAWFDFDDVSANAVPLPGAVVLLGAGLGRLAIYRRRKMNAKN